MIIVKDGPIDFEVETGKQHCSCGQANCKHLQYARMVQSNSRASLFIFLSAAHKSIRMGRTTEALHFSGLVADKFGSAVVQRYIQKIFFEESRSTTLFLGLGKNWWTDVATLSKAPKKWERVQLFPQTAKKTYSYLEALKYPKPPMEAKDLLSHHTYYEALADIFRIRIAKYSKAKKTQLAKDLYDHLPTSLPVREALRKTNFKLQGYLIWVALEEFYGLHPDAASSAVQPVDEPIICSDLLLPPPSTYDNHTYSGLAAMKRHWTSIGPGLPMPVGLDLRFTGAVFGCCFRENAYRQFGKEFSNIPWEAVAIDSHHWQLSLKLNSLYYPEFHQLVSPEILTWNGQSSDKTNPNRSEFVHLDPAESPNSQERATPDHGR